VARLSEVFTASIIRAMSRIAMKMEAVLTSETVVYFHETARRCISEDYYLENVPVFQKFLSMKGSKLRSIYISDAS
jgi:hypothetical protein